MKIYGRLIMARTSEQRTEHRLHYNWPIWFAVDFNQTLMQGQMVDVSSDGAAFSFRADSNCPHPGQKVTARFSVPCHTDDICYNTANYTRICNVRRVDEVDDSACRVAIQFTEPLPFKPGEHADDNQELSYSSGSAKAL